MYRSKIFSPITANVIMTALILASSMLSNLATFGQYTILFELIFIFYCTLIYQTAIPSWLLIIYGLLKDMLCLKFFGYHPILFTSFRFILELQAIDLEYSSFKKLFISFGITLLTALIIQALIMKIAMPYDFYQLLRIFLHQYIATILCYPIFYYIFNRDIKFAGSVHDL